MKSITAIEQERINHINSLMAKLHDNTNQIYEGLVDRNFDAVYQVVNTQIVLLDDLKTSLTDDI